MVVAAPTTRPTTTSGWCGPGKLDMVTPEMPPRSDNWYGWAKAAYELLGFVFATGQVDGRGSRSSSGASAARATTTSTTWSPATSR